MMKQLLLFNGTATRKEWWLITAVTGAVLSIATLIFHTSALLCAVAAIGILPWLAVSARRMQSTGNETAPCLFSFAGLTALVLVLPLLSDSVRDTAAPFVQLLLLIGGIVALSYALICGFVKQSHRS